MHEQEYNISRAHVAFAVLAAACAAACAAGDADYADDVVASATTGATAVDITTTDWDDTTSTGDATPTWPDIESGVRAFCNCHTVGGPGSGGVADIDDPMKILRYVTPGDAFRSPLVIPVLKGAMPPATATYDPAFLEDLIVWIDGLPEDTCDPVAAVDDDAAFELALADVRAQPPERRGGLRYLSLRAALPDVPCRADLARLRRHVTLALNLVSRYPAPATLRPVDPDGVVLALQLADIGWDGEPDAPWDTLVAAVPRAARFVGAVADPLRTETATPVPLVPADALAFALATDAAIYAALAEHPDLLAELEDRLGVDAIADYYNDQTIRGGVRTSEHAVHPVMLARHTTAQLGGGWLWKKGLFNGQGPGKDLFADPLTAQPDAWAVMYTRGNGLPGFFVANADGERLDVVPGPLVHNLYGSASPADCVRCHLAEGPRTFVDEVRDHVLAHKELYDDYADFEKILALYPPAAVALPVLDKDRARHQQALADHGGDSELFDPVWSLVAATAAPVDAHRAAAELGVSEAELRDKRLLLPDPLHVLAEGTVPRAVFDDAFIEALCALRPGISARPEC